MLKAVPYLFLPTIRRILSRMEPTIAWNRACKEATVYLATCVLGLQWILALTSAWPRTRWASKNQPHGCKQTIEKTDTPSSASGNSATGLCDIGASVQRICARSLVNMSLAFTKKSFNLLRPTPQVRSMGNSNMLMAKASPRNPLAIPQTLPWMQLKAPLLETKALLRNGFRQNHTRSKKSRLLKLLIKRHRMWMLLWILVDLQAFVI